MTDLSRSEIEWVREDGPSVVTNGAFQTICDMALAKKDAEERVAKLERTLAEKEPPAGKYCYVADKRRKQAEAECERLRALLEEVSGTWKNGRLVDVNEVVWRIDAALEGKE